MERPREVHRVARPRTGTNKTPSEQPVRVIERDGDERETAPATIALPIDRHQTVGVRRAFPPVEASPLALPSCLSPPLSKRRRRCYAVASSIV